MLRSLPLALAAVSSLAVALVSWRFFALGLAPAFPEMLPHIEGARLAFLAHVIAAPVALALGAFQFMPRLRARRPRLHRISGWAYSGAILVAGLSSLAMTATMNGGFAAQLGFGMLALLWIATTGLALRAAVARRFEVHRQWMMRSFALTFAAVTLRLLLVPMMAAGMDYTQAIPILAWASWLPNLAVAELMIRRRARRGVAPVALAAR